MTYPEFLLSDYWLVTRAAALKRASYQCALNAAHTAHLEVHHRTYVRLGFEHPDDLIVLCSSCHARHHSALPRRRHVDGQLALPI